MIKSRKVIRCATLIFLPLIKLYCVTRRPINIIGALNSLHLTTFDVTQLVMVLWQGRNMVYGLRAQSPKYDWDQGSEERAQGSEEWC